MADALYLCYFGIREPLVQTQVLPYLRELVKGGNRMSLLTFEPGEVDEDEVRAGLADDGIEWHWLRYHKRPSVPATLYDVVNGARFVRGLDRKRQLDVLHARAHVPMMMAVLASRQMRHMPKLLFDIRGFVPEEYIDAGIWPKSGSVYRGVKRVETGLMKAADGFVVLTEAARNVLFPESVSTGTDRAGRPVAVIPCCVDFERRFAGDPETGRANTREKLGIGKDRLVLTHVGALGGLYLTEEIVELLGAARAKDPSAFALFLTQSDPSDIVRRLTERGFAESDYFVGKVPAAEVENYLYASDVGLSFVKATYATKSRSPTKIPEYLAAGLPVIANAGVGDVDQQLTSSGTGVIVEKFDEEHFSQAISQILVKLSDRETSMRCKHFARSKFDLSSVGGALYRNLYEELFKS